MKLVSLDLETTGLIPGRHEAWEIGIVPFDLDAQRWHVQFVPENLAYAEGAALSIGGFYDRSTALYQPLGMATNLLVEDERFNDGFARGSAQEILLEILRQLDGATLMGLNVGSFDCVFFKQLVERFSLVPNWHHRQLELGSFVAGAWGARRPLSGSAINERAEKYGITNDSAHNAFADAQWNMDVYRWVTGQEV